MVRLSVPFLILAVCGCGTVTCLSLAQENPTVQPIYGGVRTDLNCIIGVKPGVSSQVGEGYSALTDRVAKPCSVIDLPLSLAADTVTLPYSIWWTIRQWRLRQAGENEVGAGRPANLRPTATDADIEGSR